MKIYTSIILIPLLIISCDRENTDQLINDGIAPIAPIGLRVYLDTDGEIGFEWPANQESGIKGYNIFKFINDTVTYVSTDYTENNFYEEFYLEYDSIYFYRITAIDVFGLESNPSKFISFQPKNRYVPFRPSQLSVNGKNWFDSLSIELRWYPPVDTDIGSYEIHRSVLNNFETSDSTLIASTSSYNFIDTVSLKLLTQYYYKIISVDKGGLKSRASFESNDLILDRPILISPADNEFRNYFSAFEIKTVGASASYKLFIQSNKLIDIIYEKEFSNSQISSNIIVSVGGLTLEPYKKYYWRVAAYSKSLTEVNSFSEVYSFTIIP